MPQAKHKSHLDRLVSANRGKNKGKIKKAVPAPAPVRVSSRSAVNPSTTTAHSTRPQPQPQTDKERSLARMHRKVTRPELQIDTIEKIELEEQDREFDEFNESSAEEMEFEPETLPEESESEDSEDENENESDEGEGESDTDEIDEEPVLPTPPSPVPPKPNPDRPPLASRPVVPPSTPPRHRPVAVSQSGDSAPGQIVVSLELPLRVVYDSHRPPNVPLRQYLVDRLIRCQDHHDERSMYINGRILREIERVTGRNFDSGEALLGWLLTSAAIHYGDLPLHVEPELIERAEARRDADQSLADVLSEYLTAGIEIKTGMR